MLDRLLCLHLTPASLQMVESIDRWYLGRIWAKESNQMIEGFQELCESTDWSESILDIRPTSKPVPIYEISVSGSCPFTTTIPANVRSRKCLEFMFFDLHYLMLVSLWQTRKSVAWGDCRREIGTHLSAIVFQIKKSNVKTTKKPFCKKRF